MIYAYPSALDCTENLLWLKEHARATRQALCFMGGVYNIYDPIVMDAHNQRWFTDGEVQINLKNDLVSGFKVLDVNDCVIDGFRFSGTTASGSVAGIETVGGAGNPDNLTINKCKFDNLPWALIGDGLSNSCLSNSTIDGCGGGVWIRGNANSNRMPSVNIGNCLTAIKLQQGKGLRWTDSDVTHCKTVIDMTGGYDLKAESINDEVTQTDHTFLIAGEGSRASLETVSMVAIDEAWENMLFGKIGYGSQIQCKGCRPQADPTSGDTFISLNRQDTFITRDMGDFMRVRVTNNDGETIYGRYMTSQFPTQMVSISGTEAASESNEGQYRRVVATDGTSNLYLSKKIDASTYAWDEQ